jgi:hypothetical protein
MGSKKVVDIIFDGEFGVKFRPVMRHAHESQNEIQLLDVALAERSPQGLLCLRCLRSLEKNVSGASEQGLFFRTVGCRERGEEDI